MMPPTCPSKTTAAEAEVFRRLRDAPDTDDWICLHSLGLARHERKEYAEADFVVISPAGVFCLEVKGGEIKRKDGLWEIGWPGKTYFSAEGPFKQAQGARWALSNHLEAKGELRPRHDFLMGWGVVFPDVEFDQIDPEWDPAVVFDQRDKCAPFGRYVAKLEAYFRDRLSETGRRPPPRLGRVRIEALAAILRGDFEAIPSLRGLVGESDRELVSLCSQQYAVLDFALNDGNPRILCEGGAGTGKTLVAVEAARRLAASGLRVLMVCFNQNLNRFLKLEAAAESERFEVRSLHAYLSEVIRRGGFGAALDAAFASRAHEQVFAEDYPRLFEAACMALLEEGEFPQYDVLIVDEAQDVMTAPLMNCLDLVLKDGFASGRWAIFYDPGLQADLYARMNGQVLAHLRSLGPSKFVLKDNFRNPKTIVAEMCAVTDAPMPPCRRDIVSPVDYRVCADEREQARKLRALLIELMREGLGPERISVLSTATEEASSVVRFPPEVGKPFRSVGREPQPASQPCFTTGSIAGFKGLENDVVILTDVNGPADNPWLRALLYVGMTRARVKLFALVGQDFYDARFGT